MLECCVEWVMRGEERKRRRLHVRKDHKMWKCCHICHIESSVCMFAMSSTSYEQAMTWNSLLDGLQQLRYLHLNILNRFFWVIQQHHINQFQQQEGDCFLSPLASIVCAVDVQEPRYHTMKYFKPDNFSKEILNGPVLRLQSICLMKDVNVDYFISHFILSEIEVWLLTPWPGPLQSQLQYSASRARLISPATSYR